MGVQYLLDTDICIYIHRNRPERVARRFASVAAGELAISVITFGELLCGALKNAQTAMILRQLNEFVVFAPVLALPARAAEFYGTIRAELEGSGTVIDNNDMWIAAHAKAEGLTLVTNNEKEFRRVRGLRVQNWVL
ncbi:MAG: type II toxin-antitoxin system VapC family toxin [Candidatus Acidiferrum sp.]|jgi:tRNA(fMet)-specific endonuclease VapC